jgi:hypothetical protein
MTMRPRQTAYIWDSYALLGFTPLRATAGVDRIRVMPGTPDAAVSWLTIVDRGRLLGTDAQGHIGGTAGEDDTSLVGKPLRRRGSATALP